MVKSQQMRWTKQGAHLLLGFQADPCENITQRIIIISLLCLNLILNEPVVMVGLLQRVQGNLLQ